MQTFPHMQVTEELVTELEQIVDCHSLREVLYALATMCTEKAEHLNTNWQDRTAAHSWLRDYKHVSKAGDGVEN